MQKTEEEPTTTQQNEQEPVSEQISENKLKLNYLRDKIIKKGYSPPDFAKYLKQKSQKGKFL